MSTLAAPITATQRTIELVGDQSTAVPSRSLTYLPLKRSRT